MENAISQVEVQAMGTFDKLQNEEFNEREEAILFDEINDQDIEDLLNGVLDPFEDDD
jgi:hypothetical protein